MERLKASREKFLSRFRHVEAGIASPGDGAVSKLEIASSVHDVMVEEWKQMRMENADLPQIPTLKRSASFPECTPGLVKKANWDPLYGSNDDLFVSQVKLAYIFQQSHSLPNTPLLLLSSHTLPSSYTLSSLLAYTPFFLPHTQSSTDVDEDIDYVLSVMDELTQELVKEGEWQPLHRTV